MKEVKYAVLIEKMGNGYGACVPDLPGCVAGGPTVEEVTQLITEAIPIYIQETIKAAGVVPEPRTLAIEVKTAA